MFLLACCHGNKAKGHESFTTEKRFGMNSINDGSVHVSKTKDHCNEMGYFTINMYHFPKT